MFRFFLYRSLTHATLPTIINHVWIISTNWFFHCKHKLLITFFIQWVIAVTLTLMFIHSLTFSTLKTTLQLWVFVSITAFSIVKGVLSQLWLVFLLFKGACYTSTIVRQVMFNLKVCMHLELAVICHTIETGHASGFDLFVFELVLLILLSWYEPADWIKARTGRRRFQHLQGVVGSDRLGYEVIANWAPIVFFEPLYQAIQVKDVTGIKSGRVRWRFGGFKILKTHFRSTTL